MINEFISSQSFDKPHYLAPSGWVEHIPFAFELINKLKPAIIVELGVFQGSSYFSFCQAVHDLRLPSVCYGIDTWQGDEHAGFLTEEIFNTVSEYNKTTYADFSNLIRSDFNDALQLFADKSIDLLHIDGLHTYEAVKNDFESWLPKLSDSSIVLFHDIAVKDRGFGVFKLWEELSAIYPSFSFEHGYGLGVLASGKNIPPDIFPLFHYSQPQITEVRTIYHRLGSPFSDLLKIEQLQRSADEWEAGRDRILQLQQEVEKLGAWSNRSAAELETAQDRLLETQTELSEKIAENDLLQLQVKDQAEEVEQKSNQAYRLAAEKKELEARLQDIYSSDGYRLLARYYRLKGKLVPENSPRHLRLKAFGKFIKSNPIVNKLRGKTSAADHPVANQPFIPAVPAGITFPLALPVFDQPLVSIIVPAYNNWPFTRNCLISIYQHTHNIPYEIIVGDNVSTDETVNFNNYFTNVNYIRNQKNLGYILNINNAAGQARGRFILTLNNDTTVTDNWLSSMLDVMNKDEKVGLVGSKLVFPDGTLQEAGGIIWNDASGWNYGRGGNPQAPEYNYLKEVDYISGASNLIRKEVWEKLKGLDERYIPAYFDDSDLAFGIRQLGYKTIYQPLSVVVHYEGLTHGTSTSSGTKQYQVVNAGKFLEKWKDTLTKDHFANAEQVFHARDRSRGKKTIVVIDHYVPHFDKDAGSRNTFQLLQLFIRNNYNVKFIGDNFYRHEPYTTILEQMGIEVLYGEWYRDNWQTWILQNKDYIDFFYINRPHISAKYIDLIKANTKAKVIYFGHDLHFIRELRQYEIEKDPALLRSADAWKLQEAELIKKSDTVLTLSSLEKEIMEKEFGHTAIEIMPIFFYDRFKDPVINFDDRADLLFVGGFNHKPNVDGVIWFVKEVFPLIGKHLKNVRFIIAGSLPPKEVTKLASNRVVVKGYVSDEELGKLYKTTKLVVIPLRYGAGVKGKTAETIYQGIPFVATRFGIEGLIDIAEVTDSRETAQEFADRIVMLYNDHDALREFSRREIEYARRHFSEESATAVIRKVFSS